MTFRLRSITRPVRRTHASPEDRQNFWVNVGFVGIIVSVVVILVAALGVGYYNDHLKPVASVGGTQVTRDEWTERALLTLNRIRRSEARVRETLAAGEIDAEVASARLQSLASSRQQAPDQAIEDLIDLIFQGQLATEMGLTVTDAEVDAAAAEEASTPERRHVEAIFVEPERESAGEEPTPAQRRDALERAEAALAELEGGADFAQVAEEYSTDLSRENGGDYGIITDANPTDTAWVRAVFDVEQGATTEIIKGADGTYRIGRVVEILPGRVDTTVADELRSDGVSDAGYRNNLRREVLSRKLVDRITSEATSGDVDQVRLSEILIVHGTTGDEASGEGEVHASHILYSPKDDPAGAADVPAEDPAWAEAEAAARAADAELRAIADVDERTEAFADRARAESDDRGSGEDGGDLGFFSRSMMVPEFADPLFEIERTPGEIVGPVKSEFGYHVILFQELRPPAQERVATVVEALEEPDADFAELAREHSDGDEAEDGGDIGWVARYQLPEEAETAVFALQPGGTTEAIELEDGFHIYRVTEREARPIDAEQRAGIEANAFTNWYDPKKQAAEEAGTITRDEELFGGSDIVDPEVVP
jgi:parvulin-like peptidyl-prolyl isomerase